MEDPTGVELETNYPTNSSCLEEASDNGGKSGNVSWVLNIGKKFVISGMLMTSVPLILPPLVVISALGIASSVPFGFICASYACTEELMSKLLPPPSQIRLKMGYEEEEQGSIGFGKEGDELVEQPLADIEKNSISSLVKTDESAVDAAGVGRIKRSVEEIGVESIDVKNSTASIAIHEDTEENVGEKRIKIGTPEKEKRSSTGESKTKEEGGIEKGILLPKGKTSSTEVDRKGKKKKITTASKLSGKKRGPKGDDTHAPEKSLVDKETTTSGFVKKLEVGDVGQLLQTETIVEEQDIRNSRDRFNSVKEKTNTREPRGPLGKDDTDNTHIITATRKLKNRQELSLNGKSEVGNVLEEQRPLSVVHHKLAIETAQCAFADGRENYAQFNESKLNETEELVVGMAHSTRKSILKQDEKAGERMPTDEKIWIEIDAIRLIVGSRAPRLPSHLEELRALYLFTGIDPPSLVGNPSDLEEVYSKLKFLKSVIGVQ